MAQAGIGERRGRRGPDRWLVASIAVIAVVSTSQAQVGFVDGVGRASTSVYFDTSNTADALLRSAANHVRGGHYAEAVEIYQRVIQQFGDKVVESSEEVADPALAGLSRLSIDVRRECQRRIAMLPVEARALYRARVDGQAERWFRQGRAERDRSYLRRVIDEAFCSSWGDDALELLGDLAFQDGQFGEALAYYTRLLPDRPEGGVVLAHPDPSVEPARVVAKKLLVRTAIGERPPTNDELEAFASAYPKAIGPFAGRRGPLAKDLIEAIRDDHLLAPAQSDGRWPTFAGSQTRSKVASGPIDVGSLQWKVDLESISASSSRSVYFPRGRMSYQPILPPPPERFLAYHPIVVGDQVIVDDDRQVVAYNLNSRPDDRGNGSGPTEVAWRAEKLASGSAPTANRGYQGLARYTLTAFGDRIYTRMGPPPSTIPMNGRNGGIHIGPPTPSFLVALDRTADGKRLWKKEAAEIPLPKRRADNIARNVVFEGSPVADARNVYVAMTDRVEMTAAYVACLDADTGNLRWIRSVCEANNGGDQMGVANGHPEVGLRLLTLDGSTLYFQTNLGAVAALDAETGGIRWLATYPGRRGPGGYDRDLNPAIVHDGLVIVAPNDAPAIYAFDAASGHLAWKTDDIPEDVRMAHLLGVAKGKLVATGDRVLLYDVKTGKLTRAWPENNQATQGFGRGLLAGDRIYWPTKSEIHILDQETGLRAEPPIKLWESFQCEGGNLAVGDGYLIVAQANAMFVFCQTSRLIDRYKVEIARSPEKAANYYRLAQVAEATGRDVEALASLEMIPDRVRPSETIDGLPLADVSRDHQRRLLMKLGAKARASGAWDDAATRYRTAAKVARTDRDRLEARLDLAAVEVAANRPTESVATLQALLADDHLRSISIEAPDGNRSIRADLLIADRLATLLRERGRDLYAGFDRDAAALLDRGRRERDPRLLEDVGRSYPAAQVVPEAWLALARLCDDLGRPGEAARAYKKLLAVAPDDALRARALWGLAHAYEAQKLWVSARDVYLQASARFPEESAGEGGERRIGAAVAERLARGPFDRMGGDRAGPGVPVPLRRRWDIHPAADIRPLGADGVPPSIEVGRIFLAQGRTIRPVDPATGTSAWVRELGGEPIWVGYLADRIIVATAHGLVALGLEGGKVEWRQELDTRTPTPDADPFGQDAPATREDGRASEPLSDFRIVGNRIFCLEGDRRLLAFDGDSGLLDWSYAPASGGRINPRLHIGPARIVLQARKPNVTLVLDTATGRRRAEFPATDEEAWPRDPLPIDEDHVALVVDRMSVALFDTNRGVRVWSLREPVDLPKNGPTRLIGDAERLVVLLDGRELVRVDPSTGAKKWTRFLGGEDLSERPESLALAGDRVFVANGPNLAAIGLADGAVLWKRPLNGPEAGWAVALIDRGVAAYPEPTRLAEGPLGSLPLAFHRREDGGLIQRFVFQSPVSDLTFMASPLGALVATRGGLWALGDRRVMDGGRKPE